VLSGFLNVGTSTSEPRDSGYIV